MTDRSSRSSKRSSGRGLPRPLTTTPIGLRELLDAAPDAIFCCDLGGRWTWLSPMIESLTRSKVSDLIGTQALDQVHPEERFGLLRACLRAQREVHPVSVDRRVRLLRPDGSTVNTWMRMRLIERADEEFAYVGILREASGAPSAQPGPVGPDREMGADASPGETSVMAGAPDASGRVSELEARIAALGAELKQERTDASRAMSDVRQLRVELLELREQLNTARAQVEQSRSVLENKEQELGRLRQRLDLIRADSYAAARGSMSEAERARDEERQRRERVQTELDNER
jgi:PAS domain S-box-containing protein